LFTVGSDVATTPANENDTNGGAANNKEQLFEGLGKGIIRDYKMRLPFYKSDVKDGLNVQVGKSKSLMF